MRAKNIVIMVVSCKNFAGFAFSHSQVAKGPPKTCPLNRIFQVRELVALRAKVLELETEATDPPATIAIENKPSVDCLPIQNGGVR